MPAAAQAACTSPEQSNPSAHGPVPPYTYGHPSWAYANATALSACDVVGPVYLPVVVPVPGPPPTVACCGGVSLASSVCCWLSILFSAVLRLLRLALSCTMPALVRLTSCWVCSSCLAADRNWPI